MAYHKVIGIDLGTTYSAVAAYDKDEYEPKILPNEAGHESVPSVVSFIQNAANSEACAVVGRIAKENFVKAPDDTIMEVKRSMGEVLTKESCAALGLDESEAGHPLYVRCNQTKYLPQEISALVLMEMKRIAETNIGERINDAVITVPAYFTEQQKKATKEAAMLAGLRPLQLVPEPTAAAISYGLSNFEDGKKTYLVYDLGGGTFDVSIITVEDTIITVVATSGNAHLGGADFDNRIVAWAVEKLEGEGVKVKDDPVRKAQLKIHAETLKKGVSAADEAVANLPEFSTGTPVSITLKRTEFEGMINDLLDMTLTNVEDAIRIAGSKDPTITKETIDAILLVGGSSKIPMVKEKLLTYFGRDEDFVRSDLNPDTVVAKGAAILGNKMVPGKGDFDIHETNIIAVANDDPDLEDLPDIWGITEHSLGVGVHDRASGQEVVQKLIHQATNIPTSVTKDDYMNTGPGDRINVNIYQGEGKYPYENVLIGTLVIDGLEPKPAGEHRFSVTFTLDANGLLYVKVVHINENKVYEDKLMQSTGVGGTMAMEMKRGNLLQLFNAGIGVALPKQPAAQPAPESAPQPAAQPEKAPEAEKPETTAPAPEQPAKEPSGINMTEIPEDVAIDAEFSSINRRVKKLILAGNAPDELTAAYNEFAKAVMDGKEFDDIAALCDEMEDLYHDARNRSS